MVPDVGIELTTYRLQGGCSTTELIRHDFTYQSLVEAFLVLEQECYQLIRHLQH